MSFNRKKALRAFDEYVRAYDPSNPRIALKIAHTYRVADLCERIAASIDGFCEHDVDLAWLCGLLHDIGRFEQVRRYDTFNDAKSVSHAALGANILFGDASPISPCIGRFLSTRNEDGLIRTVVATHSDYRLPATLDERTTAFCHVLRDADKIDILKVNCICPIEDIYGVTQEQMEASALSPAVVETFYAHRTVPRDIRVYPADILVSHICFAWELVYPKSRELMWEQGHLEQMLSRTFKDPRTQKEFERMATHMRSTLS